MLLMCENIKTLHQLTRNILSKTRHTGSTIKVDVDPISFM